MSIGFEINNRLAVITIDRPEAMNALDMAHNAELDRIWAEFRDDDDLWVAIFTGAGDKAFSACLLYTSPSPRDLSTSRMPSSA